MIEANKTTAFTSYSVESEIGLYEKTQRIAAELERMFLADDDSFLFDQYINENFKSDRLKVVALKGQLDRIDTFLHPIYYKGKVFIDARPFINKHNNSITDSYNFVNLLKRGFLDLLWVEDAAAFTSIQSFMIDAYSSWIANGLSRSLSLDIKLTQQIRVVAAIYMLSLLSHDIHVDDETIAENIILTIPKAIYLPINLVQDLIEIHPTPIYDLYRKERPTIRDLVKTIYAISNSAAKVDKAVIYNSVTRGMVPVTNATQICSIGIEHPATFVWMIESSLNSRTGLGLILHSLERRNNMSAFTQFIKLYVQSYKFQKR